jgi:tRNA threonylcarbamoyladenosine biosynthesis protein TsaE
MSTDLKLEIESTSSKQTELLGKAIGAALKGGEIIQLISDLGGGKTTLTKGIVAGMGSDVNVSSPTFTVSKEYQTPKLLLRHFDFYRLQDAGIVGLELQEGFEDQYTVTVIEWADIVTNVLPKDTIVIELVQNGESSRTLKCTIPEKYAYIAEVLA